MASFVHIADERNRNLIAKNGLRAGRRGVFCVPVTKDYSHTHQWARELKRRGARTLVCVQVRVPDDEPVSVGAYNTREKVAMTAAEAVATAAAHSGMTGLEVIFGRAILPREIVRIYAAPRIVGWRYSPAAKGKLPFCHCRSCNRGEIRARRLIRDDD